MLVIVLFVIGSALLVAAGALSFGLAGAFGAAGVLGLLAARDLSSGDRP